MNSDRRNSSARIGLTAPDQSRIFRLLRWRRTACPAQQPLVQSPDTVRLLCAYYSDSRMEFYQ